VCTYVVLSVQRQRRCDAWCAVLVCVVAGVFVRRRFTLIRMLYSRVGKPRLKGAHCFSFNKPEGMCAACQGLGVEVALDESKLLDMDKSLAQGAILHPDYRKLDGWYIRSIKLTNLFPWDVPLRRFTSAQVDLLLHCPGRRVHVEHLDYNVNFEGIAVAIRRRQQKASGSQAAAALFVATPTSAAASASPSASTSASPPASGSRSRRSGKAARASRTSGSKKAQPNSFKRSEAFAHFFTSVACTACGGSRLNAAAREVKVAGKTVVEASDMELADLLQFVRTIRGVVAEPIVGRLVQRLENLVHIGVGYVGWGKGEREMRVGVGGMPLSSHTNGRGEFLT